jgi:hypothetical protein
MRPASRQRGAGQVGGREGADVGIGILALTFKRRNGTHGMRTSCLVAAVVGMPGLVGITMIQ